MIPISYMNWEIIVKEESTMKNSNINKRNHQDLIHCAWKIPPVQKIVMSVACFRIIPKQVEMFGGWRRYCWGMASRRQSVFPSKICNIKKKVDQWKKKVWEEEFWMFEWWLNVYCLNCDEAWESTNFNIDEAKRQKHPFTAR